MFSFPRRRLAFLPGPDDHLSGTAALLHVLDVKFQFECEAVSSSAGQSSYHVSG